MVFALAIVCAEVLFGVIMHGLSHNHKLPIVCLDYISRARPLDRRRSLTGYSFTRHFSSTASLKSNSIKFLIIFLK